MKAKFPLLAVVCSVSASAFYSCQTAGERASQTPKPPNTIPPPAASVSNPKFVEELNSISVAFEKRDCKTVSDKSAKLKTSFGGMLPFVTNMQAKICDAEIDPHNKEKARTAIAAIDEVEKVTPSTLSPAQFERLRASRYLASDDKENALRAKKEERADLHRQIQTIQQVDQEILELSNAAAAFTPEQKEKFQAISQNAMRDDKLFEALKASDELIPTVSNRDARMILQEQRAYIVARIEQLFSLEASLLEDKKLAGQDAEARAFAAELKKRFPTKVYETRIETILGGGQPASAGTPSMPPNPLSTTAPATSPSPDAANVSDEQKTEKALTEARAALDSGKPGTAVDTLDALPETARTDRTRRLRREAADVHVREMREQVRNLYTRSRSQGNPTAKVETLKQAKGILEQILSKYPDTTVRSAVERNLKSINEEIVELGKAKK